MMKQRIKQLIKGALRFCIYPCIYLRVPALSKQSKMDIQTARDVLNRFHPQPAGTADGHNEIQEPICDLQIVVPAYNVEKYLAACMDSILNQETKYSYKVVLVDDGSTDRTPEIADSYAQDDRVIVIHQENRGFSGARNRALSEIWGKYLMFVDSDDLLWPGAIDALLDVAVKYDSDFVEGGAYAVNGENQSVYFSHAEEKGVCSVQGGILHGQPWGKVFKACWFGDTVFPQGYWFEDSILSFLFFAQDNCAYVTDKMVYAYRENRTGSITASYFGKPKSLDSYWITEMLLDLRSRRGIVNDRLFLDRMIRQFVLNTKRMFGLPENVQKSAFVLSANLLQTHFPQELIASSLRKPLVKALVQRNWSAFRLLCKVS